MRQALDAQLSSVVNNVRVAMGVCESTNAPHSVNNMRQILQEYEKAFGTNHSESIVTKKKGKHSYIDCDWPIICMRPSITKY